MGEHHSIDGLHGNVFFSKTQRRAGARIDQHNMTGRDYRNAGAGAGGIGKRRARAAKNDMKGTVLEKIGAIKRCDAIARDMRDDMIPESGRDVHKAPTATANTTTSPTSNPTNARNIFSPLPALFMAVSGLNVVTIGTVYVNLCRHLTRQTQTASQAAPCSRPMV